MLTRYAVSLCLAAILFLANAVPAAETGFVDIEAGPIWSNDHAKERCPEVAQQWTSENPGFRAVWTGHWTTTVPDEMSVCGCDIVAEDAPIPVERDMNEVVEVGGDLRTRRGYSHAWINEAEGISVLFFVFGNGVLQFYRDEPGMGYVFHIDLSGLPDLEDMYEKIVFGDMDGDGYADVKIPLPDGGFAAWRWDANEWRFEETATSALLPAPAATRKTLAALPAWTTPHVIVHAGELSNIASRLGYSWLLDCALDIRPERKGVLEWLRSFPMESFSLVKGLSRDDEDTFQGAIRFTEEMEEILTRLEELPLPEGDELDAAETELTALLHRLSGLPRTLVGEEGIRMRAGFVWESQNLYVLFAMSNLFGRWMMLNKVFLSVADGDGEKLLLIGSSPEEIERARNALDDESARLKIARRNPGKASFLRIADDASGSGTREMADDLYWDFAPKASAELELSLGLSDRGVELSLWHTFLSVFFGDSLRPKGGWRADDAGFSFGGGSPWLAGALSPALTEKNFLDLLSLLTRGDGDRAREALEQVGVEPETLAGAFRSIGLVLGGNASIYGESMPGGYVFVSGDEEKMRALAPIIKLLLDNRLSHSFRAVDREGWDVLYALKDEYRERAGGMPFCAGIKDGALMMGILREDDLESAPEIGWPEDADAKAVLLGGHLNFSRLVAQCQEFFETMPLGRTYEAALAVDLEDLFRPEAWANAFKFFAAMQEIEQVSLVVPDPNRVNLTVITESVDYENVWELMRTSRMLARED